MKSKITTSAHKNVHVPSMIRRPEPIRLTTCSNWTCSRMLVTISSRPTIWKDRIFFKIKAATQTAFFFPRQRSIKVGMQANWWSTQLRIRIWLVILPSSRTASNLGWWGSSRETRPPVKSSLARLLLKTYLNKKTWSRWEITSNCGPITARLALQESLADTLF